MVLNNSKWDRKAKYEYQKKHGLRKSKAGVKHDAPKWSSKKSSNKANNIVLEDSDSDWETEEEEEFLNHYYPNIGEQELTKDQKTKLRKQLLQTLLAKQEAEKDSFEEPLEEHSEADLQNVQDEIDGIYLGAQKQPEPSKGMNENVSDMQIQDFVSNDPYVRVSKTRKVPKHKVTDDFLAEYGIQSYSELIKKGPEDYNQLHDRAQKNLSLDKIPDNILDGFEVGFSSLSETKSKTKPTTKLMTEDEKKEDAERRAKYERQRIVNEMKSKFKKADERDISKVIEINNINSEDQNQISRLNDRIQNADGSKRSLHDYEADIEFLLDGNSPSKLGDEKEAKNIENNDDIDDFLSGLTLKETKDKNRVGMENHTVSEGSQPSFSSSFPLSEGQDFLDDLLA